MKMIAILNGCVSEFNSYEEAFEHLEANGYQQNPEFSNGYKFLNEQGEHGEIVDKKLFMAMGYKC